MVVVWGCLTGAIAELLARLALRRVAAHVDTSFQLDPQSIWTGPLANIPVYAIVALVVWLIATRLRPAARGHWVFVGLSTLAMYQVGLVSRRLSEVAVLVLAAGIATQAARILDARPGRLNRFVRVTTALMLAASLGGGVAWNGYQAIRERKLLGSLPVAPADAPNVLLLILDTVRATELSVYGYERATSPGLEAVARDGIRFDRAIATAPWTLPSHASMFTGFYPHEIHVDWERTLDTKVPTVAERLSAAGYVTGGFVANTIYGAYLYGLGRGFQRYRDYPRTVMNALGTSSINRALLRRANPLMKTYYHFDRKTAARVNEELLQWLDGSVGQRPFFAFLNYFDAHMPYDPPAPFDMKFVSGPPPKRSVSTESPRQRTPEEIRGLRDAYDGGIAYVDAQITQLLGTLERRGTLRKTVVIITADHGESFGEHGFLQHGGSVYLPELHVPLIIRMPDGRWKGCVVREEVSLRDVAATIASLAGLANAGGFSGASLTNHCSSAATGGGASSIAFSEVTKANDLSSRYPSASGALRSVVADGAHYIRSAKGAEELYDIGRDTIEKTNLVTDSSSATRLGRMRSLLQSATARAP
jgi:arylsulfatase A-like enzyme